MTGIIVVLPKLDDAKNIKNLLVRNGIQVVRACATGAQAVAQADDLNGGIVISGYKLSDMMYSELQEYLPGDFEMLLLASQNIINSEVSGNDLMCLSMPLKAHDLINTVDMMVQACERRKRRQRAVPRQRNEAEKNCIKEAKHLLMDRNHMSEEEAHRYIQKCSMDSGTNMTETAEMILTMLKI